MYGLIDLECFVAICDEFTMDLISQGDMRKCNASDFGKKG